MSTDFALPRSSPLSRAGLQLSRSGPASSPAPRQRSEADPYLPHPSTPSIPMYLRAPDLAVRGDLSTKDHIWKKDASQGCANRTALSVES
jgi:hypothetical protein